MLNKDSHNTLCIFIYKKRGKYLHLDERENCVDIFHKITGLKVSDGTVVFTKDSRGAIFVDGRYTLAAKSSICKNNFEIHDHSEHSIIKWIETNIPENQSIAYDPRFFSKEYIKKVCNNLKRYKFEYIDIENMLNLKKERRSIRIHSIKKTSSENRLSIVHSVITENNIKAYLISDPCSIAWLLNIRDLDSKYVPIVFGYLLITNNYEHIIYVDEMYDKIISPHIQAEIKPESLLQEDIKKYTIIGIDESETPSYLNHENFINIKNPCIIHKSIKNKVEIENMKSAAQKDSAAIINFLQWIYNSNKTFSKFSNVSTELTELEVAERLLKFRKEQDGFIGESFRCIAAADANSAIVHYSPTKQSNAIINKILLIDSGGQYKDGTTDITRTICMKEPTIEQKKYYTLVLKGHIAVANAKIPIGSTGAQLDPLARQFLWQHFADYNHGTGHGIGYLSSVHEGPISISKNNNTPLMAGMIISNEPGYYKDKEFGIRLENMLVVKEENNFLTLETISLVPFDIDFIDKTILTQDEINWINSYHKTIIDKMKKKLSNDVISWLTKYCSFCN